MMTQQDHAKEARAHIASIEKYWGSLIYEAPYIEANGDQPVYNHLTDACDHLSATLDGLGESDIRVAVSHLGYAAEQTVLQVQRHEFAAFMKSVMWACLEATYADKFEIKG